MVNYMKIGRNEPCPCKSGKKYKLCCGNAVLNVRYNRFESPTNHKYLPFEYGAFDSANAILHNGMIKCRLIHQKNGSVIIPDYLFLENGWIQPLHFTIPQLLKLDDISEYCIIYIDIQAGKTIRVKFFSKDLMESYGDNSQLFQCEIWGPKDLNKYICGEYEQIDKKIYLRLYHHTDNVGYEGITKSQTLRFSPWNYRGNKVCTNINFIYFTHIPELKYNNDLITVAMSADGPLYYSVDSFQTPLILPPDYRDRYKDSIYTVDVYRIKTADRDRTISFLVPVDIIDPKHVYKHYQHGRYFYEICFPYIHRIRIKSGTYISFDTNNKIDNQPDIIVSDYLIIGDATSVLGLAAPFEEEETKSVFKVENCQGTPIPEFWFKEENQDLFTGRKITPLELKAIDDNPTK